MAKNRKSRTPKGAVSIVVQDGMLRLRFRVVGQRHVLPLGLHDSPLNRNAAKARAAEIERDIAREDFDPTLGRYRRNNTQSQEKAIALTMAEVFEQFTTHRVNGSKPPSPQTVSAKYKPLAAQLKRFGDIQAEERAIAFITQLRGKQSPLVANQNLALLQSASAWGHKKGLLPSNPFNEIPMLKVDKSATRRSDHFSAEEIQRFMRAIAFDPHYSHYRDFCLTLFNLGLRPSEAIGLRWCHVDLARGEVTVKEVLARSPEGASNGRARVRKPTKTGSIRVLRLNGSTLAMFQRRFHEHPPTDPDQIIFTTPQGSPISDASFRKFCWARTCIKAGLINPKTGKPKSPPYSARHSFGRRLYDAGESPHTVAYTMGHSSPRTSLESYGHSQYAPTLPEV